MLLIIPTVFIFVCNYYAFRWYLQRKGISRNNLFWNLVIGYIFSGGIGIVVFFATLPFFLSGSIPYQYVDAVSLVVWGLGFVIPFFLVIKQRLKTPWLVTLGIALTPVALSLAVWNLNALAA